MYVRGEVQLFSQTGQVKLKQVTLQHGKNDSHTYKHTCTCEFNQAVSP